MNESLVNESGQDTFDSVKDVLESIRLKELRLSNLEAALELGQENNQEVRITYHSDEQQNIETDGIVWNFDGNEVMLNNLKKIPVRAIKKVEFYKDRSRNF